MKIYNYALTEEQIEAHYILEYNKIVSQETIPGDNYMCSITPNDGYDDEITKNSLTIKNYVPLPVSMLLNPADGYTSGILPEFNWITLKKILSKIK